MKYLIFLLFCKCIASDISAEWNVTYKGSTLPDSQLTVYRFKVNPGDVAHVEVTSDSSSLSSPLLVVFRENDAVISLQAPLVIDNEIYKTVGRTLCPFPSVFNRSLILSVELSSFEPNGFSFRAVRIESFDLGAGKTYSINATASSPVFYRFQFPPKQSSAIVHVESDSNSCSVTSIQPIICPVHDLLMNVGSTGLQQTMSTSGSMTVKRSEFAEFYIVLIVKPNDNGCSNLMNITPLKPRPSQPRYKNFTIYIELVSEDSNYLVPIMGTLGILAFIYFASIVYMILDMRRDNRHLRSQSNLLDEEDEDPTVFMRDDESLRSYDLLLDVDDKMVARAKVNLVVADLALKTHAERENKYKMYWISLLTLSLFYGLPAVQLVLNWQADVEKSGNLDLCWYNFRCNRQMFGFFAFNNIFSNIGYICLGVLLIIMTKEKEMRHTHIRSNNPDLDSRYGIPQHPSLMYSIGIAVIMEGILSASYHICPSSSNYQFDTSFMYVTGLLGILKIYQLRHPDVLANAHVSYMLIALFILIAMVGVYLYNIYFYILFCVAYGFTMFTVSLDFYFKGLFKFRFREFKNSIIYTFASSRWCSCLCPAYKGRFAFLIIANSINIAFLVYGVVYKPRDFASYLLIPFIANLFLYFVFYIFMKFVHGERLTGTSMFFLGASTIFWSIAIYFFMHGVSDWSIAPSASREMNSRCKILDFYDNHDIRHFFSSLAIFSSFIVLDRVDDNLRFVRRDKISVF